MGRVHGELCLSYQKNKMSAASTSAKATKPKAKKPAAAKSGNPTSSVMVKAAIEGLKERKGSSLVAIKKNIKTHGKIDPSKHSHFIKKALTSGVEKKTIVQTKGTGASGSFKLAKVEVKKPAKKASKQKLQRSQLPRQRKQPKQNHQLPRRPRQRRKKRNQNLQTHRQRRRSQLLRRLLLPRNRQRKLPQRRNKILHSLRALFRAMKCSTTYVTIEK